MPLTVYLHIIEYNNSGDKVHNLAGWQLVQIAATVPSSVAIDPVEPEFALGWSAHFMRVVGLRQSAGHVQDDRSAM